jgi:hypothetical protein
MRSGEGQNPTRPYAHQSSTTNFLPLAQNCNLESLRFTTRMIREGLADWWGMVMMLTKFRDEALLTQYFPDCAIATLTIR